MERRNADIFAKYGLTDKGGRRTETTPSAAQSSAEIFAKYDLTDTGKRQVAFAAEKNAIDRAVELQARSYREKQAALATERADELDKSNAPSATRQARGLDLAAEGLGYLTRPRPTTLPTPRSSSGRSFEPAQEARGVRGR